MLPNNPLSLVRALKGAPLSCLFAMAILHQPVTARFLATVTGYHPNTVTPALQLLAELQFAVCNPARSAWQLSASALQLPLPLINPDHNLCDRGPTTTTALINTEEKIEQLQLPDRSFCDSNLAAFRAYGLGNSAALLKLCQEPDLTPEYIHAQAVRLRSEKRLSPALLFHVCRAADPLPLTREEKDLINRRRYTEGPYAEFIES